MSEAPRIVALNVVSTVRNRDAYAHEVLASALSRVTLSPRDRGFATRLAYGTIACRGTLDEAVARFLSRPDSLEPAVSDALAIAAYELLFMGAPPHAAVSEGVELVRSVQPKAAGLANAVLRKVAAAAADFPWGDPATDEEALARKYGHPLWLSRMWTAELGRDVAAQIMEANNGPAPLYFAHLPFERAYEEIVDSLAREGVEPLDGPLPGCIEAQVPAAAVKSKALGRHDVTVCDAAAQFTAACVRARPGDRIMDIGAGRGTKSLIMAGSARLSGGTAHITAVDSHAFKLEELSRIAGALGVTEIHTLVADATSIDDMPRAGSFDAALVDAPCSGLGTLRRHPDRRWRAKPEECETLAVLGAALLETAARLVKPGGFVVYSTCTVSRVENDDVIRRFLDSEAGEGFEPDTLSDDVPAGFARWIDEEGRFQSLPEAGGPDGHFVARLKRVR